MISKTANGLVSAVSAKPLTRHRSFAGLALAASLVLVVGASLWLVRTYRTVDPGAGNAAPTNAVQSITDNLMVAERHYQLAIEELEKAARSDDGSIDPEVAAVLERNLQVIDQAIAESRSALQAEPQSAPACSTSLHTTRLLRYATDRFRSR